MKRFKELDLFYVEAGKRLRAARKQKGWSQVRAGKVLNISQSAYARLESGETPIRLDQMIRLSTAFGVSARRIWLEI